MMEWIVSIPLMVLIFAVFLWWLLGRNDNDSCGQCGAPMIFGSKCLSCGNVSVNSKD